MKDSRKPVPSRVLSLPCLPIVKERYSSLRTSSDSELNKKISSEHTKAKSLKTSLMIVKSSSIGTKENIANDCELSPIGEEDESGANSGPSETAQLSPVKPCETGKSSYRDDFQIQDVPETEKNQESSSQSNMLGEVVDYKTETNSSFETNESNAERLRKMLGNLSGERMNLIIFHRRTFKCFNKNEVRVEKYFSPLMSAKKGNMLPSLSCATKPELKCPIDETVAVKTRGENIPKNHPETSSETTERESLMKDDTNINLSNMNEIVFTALSWAYSFIK